MLQAHLVHYVANDAGKKLLPCGGKQFFVVKCVLHNYCAGRSAVESMFAVRLVACVADFRDELPRQVGDCLIIAAFCSGTQVRSNSYSDATRAQPVLYIL